MENQKAISKLIYELNKLDKTIEIYEGLNELEFEFDQYEFFIKLTISVELTFCKGDYLTPPSTEVEEIEGSINDGFIDYIKDNGDSVEIQITAEQEQQVINSIINKSILWSK